MESPAATTGLSQLRPGDAITVKGRAAFFLYRRGEAAIVRFAGERESRVVPLARIALLAT
jgi:hypothetical protein